MRSWDVLLEEFIVIVTAVQVDTLVQFFLQKRSDHGCAEVIEGRKVLSINQSSFNSLNIKFISMFELKTWTAVTYSGLPVCKKSSPFRTEPMLGCKRCLKPPPFMRNSSWHWYKIQVVQQTFQVVDENSSVTWATAKSQRFCWWY